MDRFRDTFEFIRSRLGALKPTHKMLIGSAVVIMAMTLFIVAQYSGGSRMVPLSVAPDQRAQIVRHLENNGIRVRTGGPEVLVPAHRQFEAMSIVSEHNALGENASTMLLEMVKQQPWYANRQQNMQIYYAALGKYLGDVMSGWSYVRSANVNITPPPQRATALGRQPARASASVSVVPQRGELEPSQVEGIAMFVAGAAPDLEPEFVNVIDARSGRHLRFRNQDERSGSTYMDLKARTEEYWEQKIFSALRHIPGVIVAVNAQLDVSTETISDVSYKREGDGTITPLLTETTTTSETHDRSAGAAPGVQPNTGQGLTTSSGGGSGTRMEETSVAFDPRAGVRQVQRIDPKGYARQVNATVRVPRSYLARIWQKRNPDADDPPNDDALRSIEQDEREKIVAEVEALISTEATGSLEEERVFGGLVVVNAYYDFDSIAALPEAQQAGPAVLGLPTSVRLVSWPTIAMGAFALISLFMMFRLARSSTQKRELPTPEELVGLPPSLMKSVDELVGEADEATAAIDALELDDDELRTRNIVEQVGEMVNANPEEASRLVSRWIAAQE